MMEILVSACSAEEQIQMVCNDPWNRRWFSTMEWVIVPFSWDTFRQDGGLSNSKQQYDNTSTSP
jgi:hypothetical protein